MRPTGGKQKNEQMNMLKREIRCMIVAAATALAAVSCVNKINGYDAERIISFKALRANSTKAPSNSEEMGAFKVWGYALPQDKNWNDDFKEIGRAHV